MKADALFCENNNQRKNSILFIANYLRHLMDRNHPSKKIKKDSSWILFTPNTQTVLSMCFAKKCALSDRDLKHKKENILSNNLRFITNPNPRIYQKPRKLEPQNTEDNALPSFPEYEEAGLTF